MKSIELSLDTFLNPAEQRRRSRPEPLRKPEVEEIVEANRRWGNSDLSLENARALTDAGTFAVVTGQQAGLLLGPLYTIYKAIGAIKLAAQYAEHFESPVVPIFWIASEDHDFDEIGRVHYFDKEGVLQSWSAAAEPEWENRSIFEIPARPLMDKLLVHLQAKVQVTSFSEEVFHVLRQITDESDNLEDLFARLLIRLLGSHGLICVTPRMQFIRRRAVPVLRDELEHAGETSRRVIASGGDDAALHRHDTDVNLFLYDDGWRRQKIALAGDEIVLGKANERIGRDALLQRLDGDPSRFSTNVVTRPVVQDSIIPTLAYVAGPGELQYFAELDGVYEFFGVQKPAIVPRPTAVLLEPRVRRSLDKIGVNIESFLEKSEAELRDLLAEQSGGKALDELQAFRWRFEEEVQRLEGVLPAHDTGVDKALRVLKEKSDTALSKLRERCSHYYSQKDAAVQRHYRTARGALKPDEKQQERVLNIWFPFLNRMGPGVVERIYESLELFDNRTIIDL